MKGNSRSPGTDNASQELNLSYTKELSTRVALAQKFNELINERGLNQTEAAEITGLTQSKISQLRHYKLQNISLERLMQALVSLDQRVEIIVQPAHRPPAQLYRESTWSK